MTLLTRKLRLYWVRYFVPTALERDPLFRATMDGLTRRGLAVAGTLAVVGVGLYLLGHLLAGKALVWSSTGEDFGTEVTLWNKLLIGTLGVLVLALARFRPNVRIGRLLMGLLLLVAAWSLVLEDVGRQDYTFTAGWLALVMLITVGTVPFQPWQTLTLCLGIGAIYVAYASGAVFETTAAGVPTARLIFLGLVTFVCTSMSAALYLSRYEQYRALRRVERLKEYLGARSEALEQALIRERQVQTQLVQKEKLASLGQLTAGIAHEIKNPLNFVNNFAQLSQELVEELAEELGDVPERSVGEAMDEVDGLFEDLRVNTAKIAEHGRRADGIVRSMLAHARTTPGDRRSVDLNALLAEYVGLAYHGMRARQSGFNVDLQQDLDEELLPVPVVPEELGRVFLNLLDNAFDAVRARAAQEGPDFMPTVRIVSRREPEGALIRISDNGTGIAEADHAKVFEPFFTTKPSGEGTGLGLSLAYEIVTKGHGGSLMVESDGGEGTTFTLLLPTVPVLELEDEPVPDTPSPDVPAPEVTSTGGRSI